MKNILLLLLLFSHLFSAAHLTIATNLSTFQGDDLMNDLELLFLIDIDSGNAKGFSFGMEQISPKSINGITYTRRGATLNGEGMFMGIPLRVRNTMYLDYVTAYTLIKIPLLFPGLSGVIGGEMGYFLGYEERAEVCYDNNCNRVTVENDIDEWADAEGLLYDAGLLFGARIDLGDTASITGTYYLGLVPIEQNREMTHRSIKITLGFGG